MMTPRPKVDESYTDEEAQCRFEATLRGALKPLVKAPGGAEVISPSESASPSPPFSLPAKRRGRPPKKSPA